MTEENARPDIALEGLLRNRRSCRAFRPEPVPRPTAERMLALAQRSASWCNTQPWQVTVTDGRATEQFRQALYQHAMVSLNGQGAGLAPDVAFPARYSGTFDQRRKEVGRQLYHAVGIGHGDRSASQQALENFRFFGAPHVLLIHVPKDLGTYGAVDCGVYVGTLLLAAESLGIAMIPQAALAAYSQFVRSFFAIPDHLNCLLGASFGYAEDDHPANSFRASRAPLQENVTWLD